jgi:uncharacterized protein with GYD domain
MEKEMLFICMVNWTEQGIKAVKDSPKRAKAARALAKKVGVNMKELYLTSGDSDILVVLETPNGDNVAKFAMAIGSQGSVRTKTFRAWTETEYQKLVSELP